MKVGSSVLLLAPRGRRTAGAGAQRPAGAERSGGAGARDAAGPNAGFVGNPRRQQSTNRLVPPFQPSSPWVAAGGAGRCGAGGSSRGPRPGAAAAAALGGRAPGRAERLGAGGGGAGPCRSLLLADLSRRAQALGRLLGVPGSFLLRELLAAGDGVLLGAALGFGGGLQAAPLQHLRGGEGAQGGTAE